MSYIGDDVFGNCDFVETIYVPLGAKGKFEALLPDEFENIIVEKLNYQEVIWLAENGNIELFISERN